MLVGIYTNKDRDEGLKYTRRLIDALDSCGLDRALHDSVRIKGVKSFGDDCSPRPDVIVVLGGDGSILSAVAFAAVNDIPILGVNTGNVGFLSSCGAEQIEECAERLKRGDYTVATRSMVCTDIGGKRSYALNDIVFCRGNIGKTVRFTVRVNGAVLGRFKADRVHRQHAHGLDRIRAFFGRTDNRPQRKMHLAGARMLSPYVHEARRRG